MKTNFKEGHQRKIKNREYGKSGSAGLIQFFKKRLSSHDWSSLQWTDCNTHRDVEELPPGASGFVNLHRLNDIRFINKYLKEVNIKLNEKQHFICCVQIKNSRKSYILNAHPKILSYPYYCFDFLITRVLPKSRIAQKLYAKSGFRGNRVITLAEALGRLVYCGFEIVDYRTIESETFILTRKREEPSSRSIPSGRLLITLPRVGYEGKMVNVYKLRTMHQFSEYLQEFLFSRYGSENGDKINNDFRITSWGRIFRKYWIDELPMFMNFFKGELKVVGVRPLSKHKFYTYPEYLREKRVMVKPGLVPPFYADLPKTPEDFYKSEESYIESYLNRPIRTDIRYFFKAFYNIFFKGARSK